MCWALEERYQLFPDALFASAAMERLMHHVHVLVLEDHSFRNPPRRLSRTEPAAIPLGAKRAR